MNLDMRYWSGFGRCSVEALVGQEGWTQDGNDVRQMSGLRLHTQVLIAQIKVLQQMCLAIKKKHILASLLTK
jgi:hypothetical protein